MLSAPRSAGDWRCWDLPLAPEASDRPPALPDVFGVNAKLRKAITGGATPNGGPASVEAQGGVQ